MTDVPVQNLMELARRATSAAVIEIKLSGEEGFNYLTGGSQPIFVGDVVFETAFGGSAGSSTAAADWVAWLAVVPFVGPSAEWGWIAAGWDVGVSHSADPVGALEMVARLIEERLDRSVEASRLDELSSLLRSNQEDLRQARDLLSTSNRDLEQFAYIAAHELADPLRSVAIYAELLAQHSNIAPDESAEFVDQCALEIRSQVHKMTEQVNYLLELSRADFSSAELEIVSIGDVVSAALDTLADDIEAAAATVIVGELPRVEARRVLLQSVIANLVSNSIRYRAPERDLVVTIGARRDDSGWRISVTDNGSGIEAGQERRVLEMFERDTAHEGGAGIGLAISRRVIESLGGSLAIESGHDVGTVAWFWLPSER